MRQHSLIVLVGMLALLLGSCGGEETPPPTASSPSATPSQAASPASPSPQASASAAPFSSPPLVAQQPAVQPAVPGLVQPTNPETRVPQVEKGRKDPFAIIPVQPVVKVSPTADQQEGGPSASEVPKPVPQLPAIPQPPNVSISSGARTTPPAIVVPKQVPSRPTVTQPPRGNVAARPTPTPPPLVVPKPIPSLPAVPQAPQVNVGSPKPKATAPRKVPSTGPSPGVATTPFVPPSPLPSFKPELPRLPEPTLAQSVEVSGVVQVGDRPQAIVKAPNEPTSRYVTVGQRLANGQVLVKRIEMNEGSNPVVILEQYGIEIAKAVGEKAGPTTNPTGRPAASVPLGMRGSAFL